MPEVTDNPFHSFRVYKRRSIPRGAPSGADAGIQALKMEWGGFITAGWDISACILHLRELDVPRADLRPYVIPFLYAVAHHVHPTVGDDGDVVR